jgi:hypothetical protein
MEPSQHKDVVHNPVSGRTSEKIEELQEQISALEEQLGLAHDTIGTLNSLLAFERKRNAS